MSSFFGLYIQRLFRDTPAPSVESIWMEGAALPSPRTEIIAANLEEAVYVIGGFTLDGKITDIGEIVHLTIIPGFIT